MIKPCRKALSLLSVTALTLLWGCPSKGPEAEGGVLDTPVSLAVQSETLRTTSAVVAWGAVEHASGYAYKLLRGAMQVADGTVASPQVALSDLQKQTEYRMQVMALGNPPYENSLWSAALSFTTPLRDSDASVPTPDVVVAADGTGDYSTVAAALASVPASHAQPYVIYIKEGTYKEKLLLPSGRNNVILTGDGADKTVLTFDDYQGLYSGQSGSEARSYTLCVAASDVTIEDMTIASTHINYKSQSGVQHQAMAVEVRGDRVAFYDCRITGYQDTFLGRYDAARIYLKNCYVEGNVDFIYGASVIVLDGCTTMVNRNGSVLTAPSTSASSAFGIVFLDCTLSAPEKGTKDFNGDSFAYFHLGRPWHNYPKSVFIRCSEPATLSAEGWTTMNSVEGMLFAEWGCTGAGAAASRSNGGRLLSDSEATAYTVQNIFSAKTNSAAFSADWLPATDKPEVRK